MRRGLSERLSVDLCKAYADLAAELGAPVVTMHAGLPAEGDRHTETKRLCQSLDELSRHVLDMPCKYAWENIPGSLSPTEHVQWIHELDPGTFSFALDTGHANIDGTTDQYFDACKGFLCNLHINDNNGKNDEHRIPGMGSLQWKGFMRQLKHSGYVGPLMLEIEARDRQDCLDAVLTEARTSLDWLTCLGKT